jgi:hypothetical protein
MNAMQTAVEKVVLIFMILISLVEVLIRSMNAGPLRFLSDFGPIREGREARR